MHLTEIEGLGREWFLLSDLEFLFFILPCVVTITN